MGIPWQAITYLQVGNKRQRKAYRALESLKVFGVLHDYSPVLVGTLPIAVDVKDSDLDIICEAHDLGFFEGHLSREFGLQDDFRIKKKRIKGVPSVVASFCFAGFRFEIFGQPQPVLEQHAYRHMVVEARLLAIGGEEARREIQRLKRAGLKTEPAFAQYFKLEGDPFEVLLEMSHLDEDELRHRVQAQYRTNQRQE
jgi:hypothetical protein